MTQDTKVLLPTFLSISHVKIALDVGHALISKQTLQTHTNRQRLCRILKNIHMQRSSTRAVRVTLSCLPTANNIFSHNLIIILRGYLKLLLYYSIHYYIHTSTDPTGNILLHISMHPFVARNRVSGENVKSLESL